MTEKEKIISLYKYISEVNRNMRDIIKHVSKEKWHYFLEDLPECINIKINNFFDEESNNERKILEIKKPNFLAPLKLKKEFFEWINGNWGDYRAKITIKEEQIIEETVINEEGKKEKISKIIKIPHEIKEKIELQIKERDTWVKEQKLIEKTINIFNNFYEQYLNLDKESETLEIVLANGLVRILSRNIYYPILLKKVKINFNAKDNVIIINNKENYFSELYTDFLNEENTLNLEGILTLCKKVKEKELHPTDKSNIDSFFKEFIHKLSIKGQYFKEIENIELVNEESILIEDKPVLLIRKKDTGISKAIESIINNIEEFNDIPEQVYELTGTRKTDIDLDKREKIQEEEILFVKETNREQLEIAKKIEKNNAVVVQGPPGTGKTHTIANLLGHFLAQGKNILITSQTKKALKVLKGKIPKNIQDLCISILDDDNNDMKRSVDSISEKMGYWSSKELLKNIENIEKRRINEYTDLKKIRKEMFTIKYQENQFLLYNGESFSIKEVAEYVRGHRTEINKIPGKILNETVCPINNDEIKFLKKYHDKVTKEEEKEIKLKLTDSKFFKDKNNFKDILVKKEEKEKLLSSLLEKENFYFVDEKLYINNEKIVDLRKFERNSLNKKILPEELNNLKEWQIEAIIAGTFENGKRIIWENFIKEIENVHKLISEKEIVFFDKKIEYKGLNLFEVKETLLSLKETFKNPGIFKNKLNKMKQKIGDTILLNSQKIETIEECELVLNFFDLELEKENLKNNWNKLIIKDDSPERLKNDFYEYAYEHIKKIKYFLNWNDEEKNKFFENIENSGINIKNIFSNQEEFSIEKVRKIPFYIDEIKKIIKISLCALEVIDTRKVYEDYLDLIMNLINEKSSIENGIKIAVQNKNIEDYKKWLDLLIIVSEKKDIYEKRNEILEKIKQTANDWYLQLLNQDFFEDIEDIYEIWKWKQLSQKLEILEKKPYESLQIEVKEKIKNLKKLTLELVEKKAWYNVLSFIEKGENLLVTQALIGWKQSMERIGKGTGKNAEFYRSKAKEKIAICQKAVPVWIMPMSKVIETLNPAKNKFDIVIIDEASQSDVSSLILLYMAKKVIIVGDDKQVSPLSVGEKIDKENLLRDKYLKGIIVNDDLYGMRSSLYSIAATTYRPLMLREHFRCVPEIIGYSNKTSYDYKIKPLRETNSSKLKPAVVNYKVDGRRNENGKTNMVEAETIVALICACLDEEIYKDLSFGVISLLGKEQVELIQKLLIKRIGTAEMEKHSILCGDPSHFQGDEKDVIFLTMVDSNENKEVPLRKMAEGSDGATKKRYNVAASRAKDQMWIVYSLDMINDLKNGDLRKELLEFGNNPKAFMVEESVKEKSDSVFEEGVAKYLLAKDYNIQQQWEVGAYRIDMIASYNGKRIAIECDGERWHSSEEQIKNDIERQEILERCGWEFIRIRGSKYFSNPDKTMEEVINQLNIKGIYPETKKEDIIKPEMNDTLNRIKCRAQEILNSWKEDENISENSEINVTEEILEIKNLEKKEVAKQNENLTLFSETEDFNKTSKKEKQETKGKTLSKKDIFSFLNEEKIEYIDNRKTSKLLWIIYNSEKTEKIEKFLNDKKYKYSLDKRGAKATDNRKAWRIKMEV